MSKKEIELKVKGLNDLIAKTISTKGLNRNTLIEINGYVEEIAETLTKNVDLIMGD